MKDNCEVAIVGAGAAGLAAAARLAAAGVDVVLLEARERIGGRAWTIHPSAGPPLDMGCEWLHSATRNPLAPKIEAAGFTLDRTPAHWSRRSDRRGFTAEEARAFREAWTALEARLEAAAQAGADAPAAQFLEPGGRWNALLNASSSWYNGAEWDRISALDYAAYEDNGVNWRVREGYGAALAAIAGVEAVLACPVERIDHSGARLRLATAKGALTARAAILAVPTNLLAEGRPALDPPLVDKLAAAEGLPLGVADKAFLAIAEPERLPVEGHLIGRTDRTRTGSYFLRPYGRPYVEAYFGGRLARELEAAGKGAAAAFAVDELCAHFGESLRSGLSVIAETAWAADRWSLGAYSHALPGRRAERARLAEPVDGRLFFAGEATHPTFFSTVHGAWESGERAATEALAAIRRS